MTLAKFVQWVEEKWGLWYVMKLHGLGCGVEARLYLEHQTQGYFTNEMFLKQVSKAVDIFELKYPAAQGLFTFDNAPSHCKKPEDCLNPDVMNVSDGGKQPRMRDTIWQGNPQQIPS
ncbi:MAG: hypothetical protein A6F71_10420 [Cycloclasticus sp. symbiont of Poecilosclerida sp. M]|nr:MAG: hypothetical protein A6F71_10420 [Cycloclasticus sp. symbiont of Poecilosclerida sp. M]